MAQAAVANRTISIRWACSIFVVSETCYRYQAQLSGENALIADWLVRLTHNQRNWGFSLCYLYLRHVKGFKRIENILYAAAADLAIKEGFAPKEEADKLLNSLTTDK